ncbi:CaiB/BaiF CoA-transferase family protein [Oceanicola sp. 22II-s10i]|uniref:CaiB/BaiF CoA transferase family protein n=1 Tax=Oceanicola sp. 22II-s10i TaxID=1317116 RepID=UPI001C3C7356|nr:CoA transferase [Oceanicola sp. 22II-s10i]
MADDHRTTESETATVAGARRPLARFRVLDLTHARAGPFAVRQLSDWGADVLRIERREVDQAAGDLIGARDSGDFQNLHRGKRSVGLDLKTTEGRDIFLRLARDADVIIENMRTDVKHRLGVDYEAVRAVNPGIVYGSISGFGQTGPYAERGGVDQIAQGLGGLMSVTGEPGGRPLRVGIAISDLCAGLFLAQGILTALLDREVTGKGGWVQTSLLQAQVTMLDNQAMRWLMDGHVPETAGNDHPTGVPMGTYRTSDAWMNIAASSQRLFARFCGVAGLDWMLEDDRFATGKARRTNADELKQIVAEVLATRTAEDWSEALNAAGVPCGPVKNIREVFEDPQVRHLGIAQKVQHPELGEISLIGSPVDILGASKRIERPIPGIGADTEAVLAEAGLSAEEIADLRRKEVI